MQQIINISISLSAFLLAVLIAGATEIDLVLRVVILAFIIQWIAFLPAYVFQTEKFYDLTGSLTYLSVVWYALFYSSNFFTNLNGANIAIVLLILLKPFKRAAISYIISLTYKLAQHLFVLMLTK